MLKYIIRRILILIPMLLLLSIISFLIIQLPPGSFLDTYVANLKVQGLTVDEVEIERLTRQYGLDQPVHIQYYRWMRNFITSGDLGRSFLENRPVMDILMERIPPTMIISLISIVIIWIVAVPIGVYSATHQYSFLDYVFTFLGFIGVSIPSFLFALILMWLVFSKTGYAISGLNSVHFMDAPWNFARILDMLKNVWLPLIVLAMGGTAGMIRTIRANLLDELGKQYVTTARSKGLDERKLLWKYPIRIAFNPVFSTIGWLLPSIVGGESMVAIILNLRTVGPMLLSAVRSQDMYLAGAIVMILSSLTLIGTLVSDLALAWLDPRIRYQ